MQQHTQPVAVDLAVNESNPQRLECILLPRFNEHPQIRTRERDELQIWE